MKKLCASLFCLLMISTVPAATISDLTMNWPQWELTTANSNVGMYVDFGGSIKTLPEKYRGMVMVRTAEGDRKLTTTDCALIDVNVPVTVYVCQG